jgi:putrescine transport system permease protein
VAALVAASPVVRDRRPVRVDAAVLRGAFPDRAQDRLLDAGDRHPAPYTPIVEVVNEAVTLKLNLSNFIELLRDAHYLQAYASSLKIAAISTLLCLLIGYPMAYVIARLPGTTRNVALMLVVLPSWISFLIRIYAWMGILQTNGLLNRFLQWVGLIDEPLRLMNTPIAAYIGIVYAYLPFMILPLYANLVKLDLRLLEAAYDLGARPWKAFVRITLPMSRSGIIAGCMLVMIPAVGEFVIPELLGGPDTLMIGRLLWSQFFNAGNWPMASAVAIVMLLLLMAPILIFHRFQQRELEGKLA